MRSKGDKIQNEGNTVNVEEEKVVVKLKMRMKVVTVKEVG